MKQRYTFIAILYLFVALGLSFVLQKNQSQQKVERYLYLWEDEIAKNIISEPNPKFIERISDHLELLEASVAKGSAGLQNKKKTVTHGQCSFGQVLPISLYGLPAGELAVCYEVKALLKATLLSPLFISLVFMGFLSAIVASFSTFVENERLKGQLLLSQEVSRIARQVAHDIRSPLTIIKALAEHKELLPPDKSKLLHEASARIHSVAEDLLQKGRAELSSKTSLDVSLSLTPLDVKVEGSPESSTQETCEVLTCMQDIVDQFRFKYPEIIFLVDSCDQELKLPMSEAKFKRILSNLFTNSIEAQHPDRSLKIKLLPRVLEGNALFTIEDNGKGIPSAILNNIAQEGFTHGKVNGTGVGLFAARQAMQGLGGTLTVESHENEWTKISLQWPIYEG